jgi:ATP-dependent Clp protease adapter protein ClpS
MNTATVEETKTNTRTQKSYNLILLNDDDHTVYYVVILCAKVFGFSKEKGVKVAEEVHHSERCVVYTGSLEVCELKQEQVHGFGHDPLVSYCKGSMSAIIEQTI